jgi:hypothetical protein
MDVCAKRRKMGKFSRVEFSQIQAFERENEEEKEKEGEPRRKINGRGENIR